MAKCAICGKGAHFGNNVSHSHRRSNRRNQTLNQLNVSLTVLLRDYTSALPVFVQALLRELNRTRIKMPPHWGGYFFCLILFFLMLSGRALLSLLLRPRALPYPLPFQMLLRISFP